MTLTTDVRINWPVPAVRLLDHVTRVAGGDPETVIRRETTYGRPGLMNAPAQGLRTWAMVTWSEQPDEGEPESPEPPALVILSIDNPYGGVTGPSGREIQAHEILPAVAEWLDAHDVPRDVWWWEDESAGTFHPGWFDVRNLSDLGTHEPRPTWAPSMEVSK